MYGGGGEVLVARGTRPKTTISSPQGKRERGYKPPLTPAPVTAAAAAAAAAAADRY